MVVTTRRRTRSLSSATAPLDGEDPTSNNNNNNEHLQSPSAVSLSALDDNNSKKKTKRRNNRKPKNILNDKNEEDEKESVHDEDVHGYDETEGVVTKNKEGKDESNNDNEKSSDEINDDNIQDNKKIESYDGSDSDSDQDDHEQQLEDAAIAEEIAVAATTANSSLKKGKTKGKGNPLTSLIPGYTAPMKLNTSSLDKYRPAGGIRELQKRAERTDASTKDFVLENATKHTTAMKKSSDGFLPKSYTAAYSSFKKGTKRPPDTSAGKGWFGMKPAVMTEELKTDLAVIRNRSYLDPKRFYKSADKNHSIVQVGTVIEGPSEYFSSRLTKKQRRSNITEEIMADPDNSNYAKNKFKQMSREKNRQAQMRKLKPKKVRKFY
jgi:hypothetical protein